MKKLKFLAALAAMLLMLTACGAKDNELPVTLIPDTTDAAPTEAPTEVPTQTPTQAPTQAPTQVEKEAWKIEFEKSLLENYGVTPESYEDLGGGVYQVYVRIDGKLVPYVAVDSATGDYHG